MKTPFTPEQFFDVFKFYNEGVFPVQVIFYLISCIVIILILKLNKQSGKVTAGFLALLWLWMGIVYHLIYFSEINRAAYIFGTMFILQGILFVIYGVVKSGLSFRFRLNIYGITGGILICFALIVYPVLGYYFGHIYPYSPTFGLPCPTTIFTLGLFLIADKKIPAPIIIIPFIWTLIGFTAAFNFGVKEDFGLLAAGLVTISLLWIKNSSYKKLVPVGKKGI